MSSTYQVNGITQQADSMEEVLQNFTTPLEIAVIQHEGAIYYGFWVENPTGESELATAWYSKDRDLVENELKTAKREFKKAMRAFLRDPEGYM